MEEVEKEREEKKTRMEYKGNVVVGGSEGEKGDKRVKELDKVATYSHFLLSKTRGETFFFKFIYDTYILSLLTAVNYIILSVLGKTKSRFEFNEKAVDFWTSK